MEERNGVDSWRGLRVRIGAREMTEQGAVWLAVGDMNERQMRDERLSGNGRNQRGERVIVDQARDRRAIVGRKMLGDVNAHAAHSTVGPPSGGL